MATVERFEELEVWQEARKLAGEIYRVTERGGFARDYGMRDQIRRAAVSVMSNVAEGFERRSDREFARFLQIAQGSAGEIRSVLYIARDVGYLEEKALEDLKNRSEQVSRRIARLASYLRKTAGKDRRKKGDQGSGDNAEPPKPNA
ncbi:MAG TPA: four helix bundle protein [Phycisphaerae bacterium]|nr:four helix bundle protein [Phycisphaerae bacterium]